MIDANENVTDLILAGMLAELGLQEAVHMRTEGPGPNTHVRGLEVIYGIYVFQEIQEIKVTRVSYLFFDKGLGNHKPVMISM